jgi:hypothetical protein
MANPVPKLYAVSPAIVPAAGGRVVQFVGFDIDPTGGLTCGGPATMFCDSRFLGQFSAPAHAAGKVDLVITCPDGTATLVGAVTYV